ncbi:MAG TPA: hypothetical protein VFC19_42520 [Candidatus Limnocylindrales bacterium]|nr:hypothetical protein [Candidatus Limnocylindrales bacterium]
MTSTSGLVCSYSDAAAAGTGGLTWAQQFMHEVIRATGAQVGNFDLMVTHEVSGALSIGAAVDLVRRLVVRHPVLRTSISHDADGLPTQRVHDAGRLGISVRHSETPLPGELRHAVPATTLESTFSVLFVVQGDEVVRVAMRISHLVVDAHAAQMLLGAFAELAAGRSAAAGVDEPDPASPLDLARFEASDEGRRAQRRSLEHAAAVLETAPPTMWPSRRVPQPVRFWLGDLRSADLLVSLDRMPEGRRVTRAGALIGALAAVTAFHAGTDAALLFLISGNRFDPHWTSYPGLLSQEAILRVPIAQTVGETMRAATKLSMQALRHARYAPSEMDKVRQAAADRRGVTFDGLGTAVVLNLLSAEAASVAANAADAADAPGARSTSTTFQWRETTNDENLGLFVDAYQTPESFVLGGRVDTALLSPDDLEQVLRAVEWTVVAAASREVPIAELHAYLAA